MVQKIGYLVLLVTIFALSIGIETIELGKSYSFSKYLAYNLQIPVILINDLQSNDSKVSKHFIYCRAMPHFRAIGTKGEGAISTPNFGRSRSKTFSFKQPWINTRPSPRFSDSPMAQRFIYFDESFDLRLF